MMNANVRRGLALACGVLVSGAALSAGTGFLRFSDFTPMPASAGPAADEAAPISFGNPYFEQRSIADRETQRVLGIPNSGNWDMLTLNETGPAD
jgi:hypothetical protein